MSFIYFVLILGVIVLVHEAGHLITAKMFNVYCKEFSIGMGPKIYTFKGKETRYSLRLLPVGGFVSMAGEEGSEDTGIPFERSIKGIKPWKRMIVMLAGIFMNIVLAWVIFVGMFIYNGQAVVAPKAVIAGVTENSPAEAAGFLYGDEIKKLTFSDGTYIIPTDFYDIVTYVQLYTDQITFNVLREGETLNIKVTPEYIKAENRYFLGLKIPASTVVKINPIQAIGYGTNSIVTTTQDIFSTLSRLVRGIGLQAVSGPIGIFDVTAQSAKQGVDSLILLMGILSLNVGIFNLLPVPLLDGGRVLITAVEMIVRKPINKKFEQILMLGSAALMILLVVLVTWQDLLRLL